MADRIQRAYSSTSKGYDGLLTGSSLPGRLYLRVFWGGMDVSRIADWLLDRIPCGSSGRILDVPAGTAVFTEGKWRALRDAEIVCLDYSGDMISQAEERLAGCPNVTCVQGDVGDLGFGDGCFDIVLSMNGFHAFPDKARAFDETYRVLKEGGTFLSCFYVKGESRSTDLLVGSILSRKGWFTPPFRTLDEVRVLLESRYTDVELHNDGPIAYFSAVKPFQNSGPSQGSSMEPMNAAANRG